MKKELGVSHKFKNVITYFCNVWCSFSSIVRFFAGGIAIFLLIGLSISIWGQGTIEIWTWNESSWQAVATGGTGYALAVFAYLTERGNKEERQARTARELLNDGLAIHSSMEAWIVEGGNSIEKLPDIQKNLPWEQPLSCSGVWLREVEVRALLDQYIWNAPASNYYAFRNGKRTWIVRDSIKSPLSYRIESFDASNVDTRQGLVSSKALHELCAWAERVSHARYNHLLNDNGLESLFPFLVPLAGEDRINILKGRLTKEAVDFLKWYRQWIMKRHPSIRICDSAKGISTSIKA